MVRVKLFANFREAAGVREVKVEASNVGELLEKLTKMFPKLEMLFYEKGVLRDYVNVMVNGRNIRGELSYPLKDDDEVAVFPPVSGG
uniref:MoaD family protein n=1 Tax=Archaeoglobus fulgidus TaxID=2234 RepID=A0A7C3RDI7_ARCFL